MRDARCDTLVLHLYHIISYLYACMYMYAMCVYMYKQVNYLDPVSFTAFSVHLDSFLFEFRYFFFKDLHSPFLRRANQTEPN